MEKSPEKLQVNWIERNGLVGGWPVKVKTYWEGILDSPSESSFNRLSGKLTIGEKVKIAWITPLSDETWHLTLSNEFKHLDSKNELEAKVFKFLDEAVDAMENLLKDKYK